MGNIKAVLVPTISLNLEYISNSAIGSNAAVGSSSMIIGASRYNALAKAIF